MKNAKQLIQKAIDLVEGETELRFMEMANLGKKDTGVKHIIHIFQNHELKARHGPRLKVFPTKPPSDPTTIAIPRKEGESPFIVGDMTISSAELSKVYTFIKLNRETLLRYWEDPSFLIRDANFKPAK